MNNILIIAGPSAVGKTTLAHALLREGRHFELVSSVTTRAPRADAYEGEYIYLTDSELRALIREGGVLEYTEYAGNLYGTPRAEIERIHREGRIPLLILDLEGVHTVVSREKGFGCCALYITAPMELLDRRLAERYGSDTAKRDSRMAQNRADLARLEEIKGDFYKFIENTGDIGGCVLQIKKAFTEFLG